MPSWCSEWPGRAALLNASAYPRRATQLSKVAAWEAYDRYPDSRVMISPAASHAVAMSARSSTTAARTSSAPDAPITPAVDAATRSSGTYSAGSA